MITPAKLRTELRSASPQISSALAKVVEPWASVAIANLRSSSSKTFADPVWSVVTLEPHEVALLDSPLIQRLRGVRQLGLASLVYPGACHDRLQHSLGVVECSTRMMDALDRQSEIAVGDQYWGKIHSEDRFIVRLAALLHDVGHGPFSHAIEPVLDGELNDEIEASRIYLKRSVGSQTEVQVSEILAIHLLTTDAFEAFFQKLNAGGDPSLLALKASFMVLGNGEQLRAPHLAALISGPLDADKLDYLARDSHHAGFPIAIDVQRLMSKITVAEVNLRNALNKPMKDRVANTTNQRYFTVAIEASGLGAYEQLVISRALLFDRVYYHHKTRSAESMLRRPIRELAKKTSSAEFVSAIFSGQSDDSFLGSMEENELLDPSARSIASNLHSRKLHKRAFAVGVRLIEVAERDPKQAEQHQLEIWTEIQNGISSPEAIESLEEQIVKVAKQLQVKYPDRFSSIALGPHSVIIDFSEAQRVAGKSTALIKLPGGDIEIPTMWFDPEKWSRAYEHNKQIGFVFTTSEHVELVGLASTIVFAREFRCLISKAATKHIKARQCQPEFFDQLVIDGIIDVDVKELLCRTAIILDRFSEVDVLIHPPLDQRQPGIQVKLRSELNSLLPDGVPVQVVQQFAASCAALSKLLFVLNKGGNFKNEDFKNEKELQKEIRKSIELLSEVDLSEGERLAGGETDLVLFGAMIVENKIVGKCKDPRQLVPDSDYQARAYTRSLCTDIGFTLIGYAPKEASSHLAIQDSFEVRKLNVTGVPAIQVRLYVPYGFGNPSKAKAPTAEPS